ncbi:hypothetical protein ACVIWU_001088 [Bradyrhizobium sp. USDA 4509]|nr:hypothetical protein [Bradyrhizobium elkanii]
MPLAQDHSLEGTVVAVAADRGHHFSKPTQDCIVLVEGHGVEGDAHAGVRPAPLSLPPPAPPTQSPTGPSDPIRNLRIPSRSWLRRRRGRSRREHIAGLDLERMPLGSLIKLGPTAIIELTGLQTPCVLMDRFRAGLKRHMLSSAETDPPFKSGVLGVVRAGGTVAPGDTAPVRSALSCPENLFGVPFLRQPILIPCAICFSLLWNVFWRAHLKTRGKPSAAVPRAHLFTQADLRANIGCVESQFVVWTCGEG